MASVLSARNDLFQLKSQIGLIGPIRDHTEDANAANFRYPPPHEELLARETGTRLLFLVGFSEGAWHELDRGAELHRAK